MNQSGNQPGNQPCNVDIIKPEPGFLQKTIDGIKEKITVFGDSLQTLNPFNKKNGIDCEECKKSCNQSSVSTTGVASTNSIGGKKMRKTTKKHVKKHARKTRSYKK
jgi:hypothetical protein